MQGESESSSSPISNRFPVFWRSRDGCAGGDSSDGKGSDIDSGVEDSDVEEEEQSYSRDTSDVEVEEKSAGHDNENSGNANGLGGNESEGYNEMGGDLALKVDSSNPQQASMDVENNESSAVEMPSAASDIMPAGVAADDLDQASPADAGEASEVLGRGKRVRKPRVVGGGDNASGILNACICGVVADRADVTSATVLCRGRGCETVAVSFSLVSICLVSHSWILITTVSSGMCSSSQKQL